MKFLSFSQPWLWTILSPMIASPKRIENRSWQPPISMIGQRFALHAAKSFDDDAIGFLLKLGIDNFPARRESFGSSAILGVATIDRIVSEPRTLGDQTRWFFGPFGWVLADVVAFRDPIPMKGAQGLRSLAPEFEPLVAAQIKLANNFTDGAWR